jgi:hypothetical protein
VSMEALLTASGNVVMVVALLTAILSILSDLTMPFAPEPVTFTKVQSPPKLELQRKSREQKAASP